MKNYLRLFFTLTVLSIGLNVFAAPTPVTSQQITPENLLSNPGFENGKYGWTASGGATAAANTTAVAQGSYGYDWDSNSASQTLTATAVTIPNGLKGRNGLAYCSIKVPSGTATHTLQVYDGSNIIGTTTITSSTSFARTPLNFIFPTSGSLSLRLVSVASNEPEIYIDTCYLGDAVNVSQVSQAAVIVQARRASSLQNVASASPTVVVFNAEDVDANNEFDTTTGIFTSKATQRLLISGNIAVSSFTADERVILGVNKNGSGVSACYSTNNVSGTVNDAAMPPCVVDVIPGDTISMTVDSVADTSYDVDNNGTSYITIAKFPLASEVAYRPDDVSWRVDANITGANPSLGTANVSSYTGIENGSLTLTNNSGNGVLTAQIPCSSTNSPSGTTCSSGNESVGVSFTIPRAGDVLACASFSWDGRTTGAAADFVAAYFNVVETPNNAQTITQEGKSRFGALSYAPTAALIELIFPFRVCGTLSFASAGQKTVRLMYEQIIGGTINSSSIFGDAASNSGQRDIHWEIYPINVTTPAPILVGSVTSNTTGAERIERATITNNGSTCAITRQSGSWVSSVSRPGTGQCTLTLDSSLWSAAPTCTLASEKSGGTNACRFNGAVTTSSIAVACSDDAGANSDSVIHVHCMGPK